MDAYPSGEFTDAPPRKQLTLTSDWRGLALNLAGGIFILLGLMIFLLDAPQEGELLLRLDANHTLRLMDAAGVFVAGLGVVLTLVGGLLWQNMLRL